jgi:hypothetical protein
MVAIPISHSFGAFGRHFTLTTMPTTSQPQNAAVAARPPRDINDGGSPDGQIATDGLLTTQR